MATANKEMIDSALEKVGSSLSQEKKEEFRSFFLNVIEKKMQPKEALDFSKEDMEWLYSYAYQLFSTGKYKEASTPLALLNLLEPNNHKYAFALGSCFQKLKKYQEAIDVYTIAAVLKLNDPMAFYHMSDCHVNLQNIPSALFCLKSAGAICVDNPEFANLKERIDLSIQKLEKEGKKPKTEKS